LRAGLAVAAGACSGKATDYVPCPALVLVALAQVLSDALPAKLCATLLSVLLADSLTYRRGKWRIYGEHKEVPRSTCHYALDAEVRTLSRTHRNAMQ